MPNVMHVPLVILTFQYVKVVIKSTLRGFLKESSLHLKIFISACYCNIQGSNGTSCNNNGVCKCKANIINDKCDVCAAGYFNFSTCIGNKYYIIYRIRISSLNPSIFKNLEHMFDIS